MIKIIYTKEILEDIIPKYQAGEIDIILKKYPNLSKNALYQKMSKLKIKMLYKEWSKEELGILNMHYLDTDIGELKRLLPNRTYSSITTKAEKIGLKKREMWSGKEINFLKQNYSTMSVDEICKMLPNRTRKTIIMKACNLGLKTNVFFNNDEIEFIKNNWKEMSDDEIGEVLNRNPGGIQNKRLELGLSRYDIRDSSYDLTTYLRGKLFKWKQDSIKNCNYKCVITGERFDNIHHIYGFNLIFDEFISTYNVPIHKSILSYSNDELKDLTEKFITIHNKYPLGLCLRKDIHEKFHDIYGYGYNTPEQWYEFQKHYSINN